MMNASSSTCLLCLKQLEEDNEESVAISEKGATGINSASLDRGDNLVVTGGTEIHNLCRTNYINKKDIEKSKKAKLNLHPPPIKRSTRVSISLYNSKTDCLFCGNTDVLNKTNSNYDGYSSVKTDSFVKKIKVQCETRNDEWALNVKGRIEYFSVDLHAEDCLYLHSCDVNFRTLWDIPLHYRDGPSDSKQKKVERPKIQIKNRHFL